MNRQDQRKADAHRNQQLIEREMTFNAHWQPGFDKQIDDRNHRRVERQESELLCASGGRCEGICREQHLNRPRFAGVKMPKNPNEKRKPWAERCPSAYEK